MSIYDAATILVYEVEHFRACSAVELVKRTIETIRFSSFEVVIQSRKEILRNDIQVVDLRPGSKRRLRIIKVFLPSKVYAEHPWAFLHLRALSRRLKELGYECQWASSANDCSTSLRYTVVSSRESDLSLNHFPPRIGIINAVAKAINMPHCHCLNESTGVDRWEGRHTVSGNVQSASFADGEQMMKAGDTSTRFQAIPRSLTGRWATRNRSIL